MLTRFDFSKLWTYHLVFQWGGEVGAVFSNSLKQNFFSDKVVFVTIKSNFTIAIRPCTHA